jgi:hypothetical protein
MNEPIKLPYENFIKTFTPFYIDNEFDKQVLAIIDENVNKFRSLLKNLSTYHGILEFIEANDDAIDFLLTITEISGEKFKRIITALRLEKGDIVRTEWDFKRTRREILNDQFFQKAVIELFLFGNNSQLGQKLPHYYLESSILNEESLRFLESDFYLKRLLKRFGDGKYNNDVGDRVENEVVKTLSYLGDKYGFTYSREKFVSWINRNMDFCIPNEQNPYIILESSFQTTTGSGQTTKREVEVKTSESIRAYNIQRNTNIAFVNLCDGAGWLARQADLFRIYNCSSYVVNLKTLHLLEEIILFHLPKKFMTKA